MFIVDIKNYTHFYEGTTSVNISIKLLFALKAFLLLTKLIPNRTQVNSSNLISKGINIIDQKALAFQLAKYISIEILIYSKFMCIMAHHEKIKIK